MSSKAKALLTIILEKINKIVNVVNYLHILLGKPIKIPTEFDLQVAKHHATGYHEFDKLETATDWLAAKYGFEFRKI